MNLASIAFGNGVLLVGLYLLDWTPGTIAFLFWLDAAMIGAVTFLKVASSLPGDVPGTGKSVTTYRRMPRPGGNARVSSSVPRVNPVAALPLFVLFYGALLAGYGALLFFSLRQPDLAAVLRSALSSDGVYFAMAYIAGERLWAFRRDFLRGPAWQRSDPTFHFWRPFGLAFLAWLAFFFGFLMLWWLNSPLVVLTILIVLKALAEMFNALVDAQAGEWQRADAAD